MEFRILGPLEVADEHGPVPLGGIKPRAVLAVLLLHANEPVSAERLALALWGDEAPAGSVKTVQVHVSRLRKALRDADIVATTPAGYRLRVRPGELDAERFELLVEDGRRALAAGETERAALVLREALSLWRGPPLGDLAFEPFAQAEIARLEEQRLAAFEARVEADLAGGRHRELLGELQRLLAAHPLRERLVGLMMLALYRGGRQAEALEAYSGARRRLLAEIGVEPAPELRSLHEAILRQDPSLELQPPTAELPRELDPAMMPPLVGHQAELIRLRSYWERARNGSGALVTLIGARGIGKTRLAAELAGEAHRDGAAVLYATGTDPADAVLDKLHRAREASAPALVVVDDADQTDAAVSAGFRDLAAALSDVRVLALASGMDAAALVWPGVADAIVLAPLDAEAVRAIAVGYAPDRSAEDVPVEWLLDASRGVARRVHELAGQWARREAARRVGAVAGRAAAGRGELRSIEAELADSIIELEAARERVPATADHEPPVMCPFKGLASFEATDAQYFFGRERLLAELIARLVGAPLLCVVGPSGSGKSSVLRAGLLPALAGGVLPGSERWTQVLIRPREQPLRELRHAIAGIDRTRRLVLAVDQFEEVFTACPHEDERAEFILELMRVAPRQDGRAVVVLVVRADQYGRCAEYPELASLLATNHVLVGGMRRDDLRRAIECPAQRAGLYVEPELTDELVADVENEPGALPLLSTALLELWQRRDGRRLCHTTYEKTGGVRGAVARLAEETFHTLDPAQQTIARGALMRLVAEGAPGSVERRRVPLSELEFDKNQQVSRVFAILTDRRLLTVSRGTVEFAHEALLREWPRLREWLDEDEQGRRAHRHLTDAAREWDRGGRDPGDLYRGARLAFALEWGAEHVQDLNRAERAFLDASRAAEQSGLEAAKRRTRRLRSLSIGLAALFLVAAISAVLAIRQTQRAESERRTAVSRSLATQALSRLDQNLDVAALLSLEAFRAESTIEARSAVLTVLARLEHAAGALRGDAGFVSHLVFSPDGKALASANADGTVRLWDVGTRRPLSQPLRSRNDVVMGMAFRLGGDTLASAGIDGTVQLWDVADARASGPPHKTATGFVESAAFSPDGNRLASVGEDGIVRLWDVEDRRSLGRPLKAGTGRVTSLAFSRDGEILAVAAGRRGRLSFWDVGERRLLAQLATADARALTDLAFSPDGDTLASAGASGSVQLWDVGDRRPLGRPLTGHTRSVWSLAFAPDGDVLASAGADGTVRLWDVGDRRALDQPLRGHAGAVMSVAFGSDGHMLASGGDDGTVRLWDLGDHRRLDRRLTTAPVAGVAFSPDAQTLASAGRDGTLLLWGVADRHPVGRPLTGRAGAFARIAFTPDGRTLVSADVNGTVRLWSMADRRPLGQPLKGRAGFVNSVALSPDGDTVASAGADGMLRLWDVGDRRPLRQPLRTGRRGIGIVAVSPDGETLATGDEDGTLRLWDLGDPRPVGEPLYDHSGEITSMAFSRDGDMLAFTGEDARVRLWDVGDRRPLGQPLTGQNRFVMNLAFAPDGETLSSAGDDGTVWLWDVGHRRPIGQPLTGHTDIVTSLAFSPDGQTLASASNDGTVRLWDSVLWSKSWRALRDRVCASVRRGFSQDEWQEFLPDDPYQDTCLPG